MIAGEIKAKKRLTIWLQDANMSISALAKSLNMTYVSCYNLIKMMDRKPSIDTAIAIEGLTRGYVCCMDWKTQTSEHKAKKIHAKPSKTGKSQEAQTHSSSGPKKRSRSK